MILADRHKLFLQAINTCMLKEFPDASILYLADNFKGLLVSLENKQPDLLLIDYCLKDGQLIDYITNIRERYPNMKILVCTMKFNVSTMLRYLGLIDGFIGKHFESNQIAHACQELLKGNTYMTISIDA